MDDLEIEELRHQLMDYYGTAMGFFPQAVIDLSRIEQASPSEVVSMARELGYDVDLNDDEEKEEGFGLK